MPTLLYDRHANADEEYTPTPCPDFGALQDNEAALHLALYEIEHGNRRGGCAVLRKLRQHILTTREVKSVQWLLPQVELALQCLCADYNQPYESVDSG